MYFTFCGPVARLARAVVLGGLAIAAAGRSAFAQVSLTRSDQPDLIPRELVLALISFGTGTAGGANLRVGKAPEDVPPELVPPRIEVLGSMTQFDNVIIVLGMPQSPDSAIGAMESHLTAAGWTPPPAPAPRQMPRGFVATDFTGGMGGTPNFVCRGDEMVNLTSMYRSSGGSILKLNFNRGARNSACRQRDETTFRSPYDEAPVPTLRAPAGAMTTGGSGMSTSGNNQFTLSTQLSTRLRPAEVVSHYDAQMRAAGWTPVGDGSLDFLSARTYQKKDEKARTWSATLYAIRSPEALEQDVALRLSRR